MEGEGAHLGSSLPMSIHVRARSSLFVCGHLCSCMFIFIRARSICFHLPAVAFICGQWHLFMGVHIHSWVVVFVHGWSHSFMGGCVRVHSWAVMPLARCGGGGLLVGGDSWSSWLFIV